MPQTIVDLGKLVKQKYPGAYDDLPDDEVGRKVKAKYPGAYDDFVDSQSAVSVKITSGEVEIPNAADQPQEPEIPAKDQGQNTFGQGIYDVTVGPIKDILAHQKQNVEQYGPFWATLKTGLDLAKGLIKGSNDEAVKALTELSKGNVGEFIQHAPGIVPALGPAAVQASEQMEQGNVERGLGQAAGLVGTAVAGAKLKPILKGAGEAVKTGVAETLGKTTGVGRTAIRQAMENTGPEMQSAMRGGLTETELVGNFRQALQNVKDARGEAYRERLGRITTQIGNKQLDINPVKQALDFQLKKFNIQAVPGKKGVSLDFSRSTIRDAAAQNEVRSIYNDVSGWGTKEGDLTPLGVDTLKRRVDDTYSPSSTARAIIQNVKTSARDVLEKQVPGYQQMTADYAKASRFLDALSDLSLESKNPGTAVRKLTTLLNQNNSYRKMLAEKLAEYTPQDLEGQLAGVNLSQWSPRGIMGPASGIGLVWGVATHMLTPKTAVAFAMTSPRVMGELLNFIARVPKIRLPGVVPKAAAGLNISLAGQQAQRTQSEPVR